MLYIIRLCIPKNNSWPFGWQQYHEELHTNKYSSNSQEKSPLNWLVRVVQMTPKTMQANAVVLLNTLSD